MPQWIQYDANRRTYEDIGIAPDIVVRLTLADSLAQTDTQIERVIEEVGRTVGR